MPKDLYAHLKLAEVYLALKNVERALIEYTFVAGTTEYDGNTICLGGELDTSLRGRAEKRVGRRDHAATGGRRRERTARDRLRVLTRVFHVSGFFRWHHDLDPADPGDGRPPGAGRAGGYHARDPRDGPAREATRYLGRHAAEPRPVRRFPDR